MTGFFFLLLLLLKLLPFELIMEMDSKDHSEQHLEVAEDHESESEDLMPKPALFVEKTAAWCGTPCHFASERKKKKITTFPSHSADYPV